MAIERRQADVVIAAERDGDDSGLGEGLVLANLHLRVFVVTEDGREAHLIEFRQVPGRRAITPGLVDTIGAAVGARVEPLSA